MRVQFEVGLDRRLGRRRRPAAPGTSSRSSAARRSARPRTFFSVNPSPCASAVTSYALIRSTRRSKCSRIRGVGAGAVGRVEQNLDGPVEVRRALSRWPAFSSRSPASKWRCDVAISVGDGICGGRRGAGLRGSQMTAFAGRRRCGWASAAWGFRRRRRSHRARPQPRTTARSHHAGRSLADNRDIHDAGVVQARCPVEVARPHFAALCLRAIGIGGVLR